MTTTEPLQVYLSRSYELYTLLPQVNGVSNTSIPAFLSIIVRGLAPRPEYNGFRFSFHNSVCPDFASFQTQIIRYQVSNQISDSNISLEENEQMAAAAFQGRPSKEGPYPIYPDDMLELQWFWAQLPHLPQCLQ